MKQNEGPIDAMGRRIRESRILLVDDEEGNVRVLERILARAGYTSVRGTRDPQQALVIDAEWEPDLLLLDLHMPGLDGFQVLDTLQKRRPPAVYFPILVLTGDLGLDVRQRALSRGARDFVTKPFDVSEVLLRIKNLLETRVLHEELRTQNENLEETVRERTRELSAAQEEIINRLVMAAEYRDDVTGRHAERVGVLAALLGKELQCVPREVELLRRAATLHDVGKIGIPDSVLLKPGPLSEAEATLMRSHTEIGARILGGSGLPLLDMAREIALTHHERWDGRGYLGMKGEEIPLAGRIVALADAFDSITHSRPYKGASSQLAATKVVLEESGHHFDPAVVRAFLAVVESGEISHWESRREDRATA